MRPDSYVMAITALLPLTAFMLVSQKNPYHALVIRGILGAVAALVYALFGAADVALTEALVGTMLSITLYAVAVRSSLSLRLGVLEIEYDRILKSPGKLPKELQPLLKQYHLRLEPLPYPSRQALQAALVQKEIHAAVVVANSSTNHASLSAELPQLRLLSRVQRLYTLMQGALSPELVEVAYFSPTAADLDSADCSLFESRLSNPEASL